LEGFREDKEIIFAFDNDSAGKEAINKYANLLNNELRK
jgi:DNA primase